MNHISTDIYINNLDHLLNKKIPLAKAILGKCDKEQQIPWNFVIFSSDFLEIL
ncbi:hypothetical protein [Prevotella sp.]|uniref:hypothetical protein n=1 Tax=Prevotella sp. TaxID=59823 RepID=UPI0040270D35